LYEQRKMVRNEGNCLSVCSLSEMTSTTLDK
jgi:hypothetical protein